MTGLLANPAIAGKAGAFYGNGPQLGIQIAGTNSKKNRYSIY
jgi:hypothetical protein